MSGEKVLYLSQNLKHLRIEAKEQQKELDELLRVSEATISKYENGFIEPDLEKLILLSEHFKVSIDDLLKVEMKPPLPLFASNIKFLRKKHGLTQERMSKLLGYSGKQGYSAVETGATDISVKNLIKVADYFHVTLDQIVRQDLSVESDQHEIWEMWVLTQE